MSRAERALHERAGLACRAAAAAGVAGRFRAWEQGGVLAVLATPTVILPVTPNGHVEALFRSAGLAWGPDRALAVRRLDMTAETVPYDRGRTQPSGRPAVSCGR